MIIRNIENAMIARLKKGMGRMTATVCSYGGEPEEVARVMPVVWVTFGGIQNTRNANIGKRKYEVVGRFVVIFGERSVRSEEASRHGGANLNEVGTYRMVSAVRRLLSGQDLAESGLKVDFLMPGRVRSLFNTSLERQALPVTSAVAVLIRILRPPWRQCLLPVITPWSVLTHIGGVNGPALAPRQRERPAGAAAVLSAWPDGTNPCPPAQRWRPASTMVVLP